MTMAVSRRVVLQTGAMAVVLAASHRAFAEQLNVAHAQIGAALFERALALPGTVTIGKSDGAVMLIEFTDFNCPYCKAAARDIEPLLKSEPDLRYIIVNYAVLGLPSVMAGKIAMAMARSSSPETYYRFHRGLFTQKGVIDGERALSVALKHGGERDNLLRLANDAETARNLSASATFGDEIGFSATPAYLIAGKSRHMAYAGHMPLGVKRAQIRAAA